jgi:hypothetical protein
MKLLAWILNLSMAKTAALVASGATLIALLPLSHGLSELLHHRWLDTFQPVEATILETHVEDVELRGLLGLAPRVRYRYAVDGRDFEGTLIRWHEGMPAGGSPDSDSAPPAEVVVWSRSPGARQQLTTLLRKYPVGARIIAFHDPKEPAKAALVYEPFVASSHGTGFWLALAFIALAWSFFGVVWCIERARK